MRVWAATMLHAPMCWLSMLGKRLPRVSFASSYYFSLLCSLQEQGLSPTRVRQRQLLCIDIDTTTAVHVSCAMIVPAPMTVCVNGLTKHNGSTPKGNRRGVWQLLILTFSITVAACLLCRSGDVETNPGPGCKWDACTQLFMRDFGLPCMNSMKKY